MNEETHMEPGLPTAGTTADHRVTVALTFDFDAESGWAGEYGITTPSALSRGAYGAVEGVGRVLALLERRSIPATFFIPGDTADRHPRQTKEIAAAGHDIEHHGYTHRIPMTLSEAEERDELARGIDALERQLGHRPRGYRAPGWETSPNTMGLLAEFGFEFDASHLAADRPYWGNDPLTSAGIVEIPSAWELSDAALFRFNYNPYRTGLKSPSDVYEIWEGDFDGMYEEHRDATFVLSMHPEIMGRHHRLQLLEKLLDHMNSLDGVWFASMGAIADEFRARSTAPSPARRTPEFRQ